MRDSHSAHEEIHKAFNFPDWCGHGWDAFNDCFSEVDLGRRAAILWRNPEHLAASHVKTFAEAVFMFVASSNAVSTEPNPVQLELFLIGDGDEYPRPG